MLSISGLLSSSIFLSAQKDYQIPSWIKNNAGWWAEGQIDDSSFINGIRYLINTRIMNIPETQTQSQTSGGIPSWIKDNA